VGRPLPGVEVTVRSPNGEALPAGTQGEVWVRGDQVAGEYLGRGGADDTGWFATRDGGWFDGDGFLYLTGRLDDVIVRGAENISPGEIEEALGQHPAVDEVAVVGIPDTEWGETVAAAVVLRDGASASEAELQEWVRSRLRSSRTPAHVEVRPSLPYNDTGKLLRRVLKAELAALHT
jgi:fatty-acyl-CoA synthase